MAVSGLVQGLTGFGFAIVAMAVLPLFLPEFQTAFSVVALSSVLIPFITFMNTRRGFSVRPGMILAVGAILGTWLGFWFMNQNLTNPMFVRLFGVVLVLFAVTDYIMGKAFQLVMPKWMGVPCGVAGGFFGAAFNIGGPPMVAYVYSQPWSKEQIVATLQVAFICATGLRIFLMGSQGYFSPDVVRLVLYSAIPTAIGIYYGTRFLQKIHLDVLKIGVFAAVGLLGLKYILTGH